MNVCPHPESELPSDSGSSLGSTIGQNALSEEDQNLLVEEEEKSSESSGHNGAPEPVTLVTLDAYTDARNIIRLIQCEICSKILSHPIALPCGETLCRSCLPTTFERQNISYPSVPERLHGFVCPFLACSGREHSLADCDIDITLSNVLRAACDVLSQSEQNEASHNLFLEEIPASSDSLDVISRQSLTFSGGRLSATYQMALQGKLPFTSDVSYIVMSESPALDIYDRDLLSQLVSSLLAEFDCQVCYSLYLKPTTTSCGHTFCKACLERARDHSNLCPFCRRPLSPHRSLTSLGPNKRLQSLLNALCPEAVAAREVQEGEINIESDESIPIFACTLSFPRMPMFLHIFEPRYRLMLRRAIENGGRSFGMVSHRQGSAPVADGDFDAPFTQYGVMLYITGLQMFPDGRSLIETVGTYRFKITSYTWCDGYPLAKIERVEDIPFADEEAMEAMERVFHTFPEGSIPTWARLSTQELLQQGLQFVTSMRHNSAGWFADRILRTYGQPPDDPAVFPYWLATLLPVHEREKYQLLVSTSVRERLKMVIGWIRALEQRSWSANMNVADFMTQLAEEESDSSSDFEDGGAVDENTQSSPPENPETDRREEGV